MKWGEVLAIELAVLDYSETLHDYKYRLAPNLPWLPMRNRRQVTLHGLGPGSYRFEAQGRDVNGLWTSPRLLLIEILPPFWMTTWFKLLVVLSCLAMLFGWHRLHLARQRRRTIEAQRLAQIREHVLEEALGPKAELALLTSRQKEILQLIAEGQATREIAERLGISIKTVEAHRANLMERLDIHDVAGLVRLAIRARLVKPH
jgi:DNA-binding CsgD family transcriptional regulator